MVYLAVGFFAPILGYVLLYFKRTHKNFAKHVAVAAAALALVPLLVLLLMVFSSSYLREGVRIVWTGLTVGNGKPLLVGGPREQAVVGWPNGSFAPSLRATAEGSNSGTLEIAGGDGFVFDEKNQRYLNGRRVALGEASQFGDYTISLKRSWPFFWLQDVVIQGKDGNLLATVPLRLYNIDRDRVRSLKYLIENNTVRDLAALDRVTEMDNLKEWAASIRLLLTQSGEIYILDQEPGSPLKCQFPARLSILWANLKLPVDIWYLNGQMHMTFESPWRLSCPLPPAGEKDASLIVTNDPLPGENVFILPLGHEAEVEKLRKVLHISTASPHRFVIDPADAKSVQEDETIYVNEKVKDRPRRVGTSQIGIESGSYAFRFSTVEDLPGPVGVLLLALLAYLCFLAGIWLAYPRMPGTNRWVLYGLSLVIWTFLVFRLLLAFRYIIDPDSVDSLAVKGLMQAFAALAIVPGLLLLLGRLRCDLYEGPSDKKGKLRAIGLALGYLLFLSLAFLVEFYRVPHLWSDLPDRYFSAMGWRFGGIFGLVFIYLAGYIRFLYQPDPQGKLIKFFVKPWQAPERYLEKRRASLERQAQQGGSAPLPKVTSYIRLYLGFLLYFTFVPFALHLLTGDKSVQEILIPIFFYWAPAFLWIAWRLYFNPGATGTKSRKKLRAMILYAVPTVLFPVVLVPVVIGDVGSVLAVLAVFMPLACLLLAAPRGSRQAGAAVTIALAIVFVAGGFFYQNLNLLPFKTAKVRLLNFKEGPLIQRYVLWSNAVKGSGAEGLPYQELLNGYQHSWENKAIAHEGGPAGLGFGNSPSRRSHIRQDTLQYDSAFSFFIASEYGLVGGMLLLLMYSVPLIMILLNARERFDAGHGLAVLLTSSFLIEALFHSGMNLGAFPMTGRSMPLITVNSLSELLRWALMFVIAVQTIFWRYKGQGQIKPEATSLIAEGILPGSAAAQAAAPGGRTTVVRPRLFPVEAVSGYMKATMAMALVPLILMTAVAYNGVKVLLDKDGELKEFGYDFILKNVKHLIGSGIITLDQATLTVHIDTSQLEVSTDNQLIQQQAARFNALKREEKIEETGAAGLAPLLERIGRVRTVEEYQKALEEIKNKSGFGHDRQKVTLFRLKAVTRYDAEDNDADTVEYTLTENRDFNMSMNFTVDRDKASVPVVTFAADKKDAKPAFIMGPAWVMGRWRTAVDMETPLPWLTHLSEALQQEWKRLGPEAAAARYGTLTLDRKLHLDAIEFMAKKEAELHQEVLNANPSTHDYLKKLPPRVALSIISLPTGDTLALGGAPYMNSSGYWKKDANAGWIPPSQWLLREAPRSFQVRYGGDRNFDRTLLMGSSTKPLWAAAALAIHPNLDAQFRTRGPKGEETEAFGISIKPGWDAHDSNGWVDFKRYLASSDNRYHVRLGLLALAEQAGGDVSGVEGSASDRESLGRAMDQPWRKYPQFPVKLGFSHRNPHVLVNLQDTELARNLRNMFGIGITEAESGSRVSFWTKDEEDDLPSVIRETQVSGVFRWIAPEAPDFRFDLFSDEQANQKGPRDFITLLLGGGNNLWSNVDFAAAFSTCVTGRPVLSHIVKNQINVHALQTRREFSDIAARIRPGLAAVMTEGTAFRTLQSTPIGKSALAVLKSFPKTEVYAKTGTLRSEEGARNTSRIVVAIIKWKDKNKGLVESGLAFSIVAERAEVGKATKWFAEFLMKYQADLGKYL